LADSGATKTTWKLKGKANEKEQWFHTKGINPNYLSQEEILDILRKELYPALGSTNISEIRFYGAGCSQEHAKTKLKAVFSVLFSIAQAYIYTDLLGANHAISPTVPSWVCILGTGANAGVFHQSEKLYQTPSLGYMLGDEGSGQDIGKRLLKAYFLNQMPKEIKLHWEKEYDLSYLNLLENVYQMPKPNVWMASFSPFAKKYIDTSFIESLVMHSFDAFISTYVLPQKEYRHLNIHFVGSVAFHFKEQLQKVCSNYHLNLGKVIAHPIEHW